MQVKALQNAPMGMQVKGITESPMGAFCNALTCIKLPFVIKVFVLSFLSGRSTQVLLYANSGVHVRIYTLTVWYSKSKDIITDR